jgi:hypothetical protein
MAWHGMAISKAQNKPLCGLMLCYAMLCYAMLRYAMLCYAMPCHAMPCYAMLLCYAMLCYAMLGRAHASAAAAARGQPTRRVPLQPAPTGHLGARRQVQVHHVRGAQRPLERAFGPPCKGRTGARVHVAVVNAVSAGESQPASYKSQHSRKASAGRARGDQARPMWDTGMTLSHSGVCS